MPTRSALDDFLGWLSRSGVRAESTDAVERPAHDPAAPDRFSWPVREAPGRPPADHATALTLEQLQDEDLRGKTVWEVGCGTGLAAALAARRGAREVWASDVDAAALAAARETARINGATVRCAVADLMRAAPFGGRADLVLANLPQKPVPDGSALPLAEAGGADGGALLRRLFEEIGERLAPGGRLLAFHHSLPSPGAYAFGASRMRGRILRWRRRILPPAERPDWQRHVAARHERRESWCPPAPEGGRFFIGMLWEWTPRSVV